MGTAIEAASVVITGASSGIGASLARLSAERGAARLALVGRREAELTAVAETCRSHGAEVRTWIQDLGDVDAAAALAVEIADAVEPDVWVHNAAMPKRRHVTATTVDDLDETMRVNFFSPVRMTMAVLDRHVAADRGSFVYVSSMGGRVGIPAETAYCASKAALCGWAEAMAIDLWDCGVEVRIVIPGPVDTDIWARPGSDPAHYDGPLTPPGEVAAGIIGLVEGDLVEGYFPDLRGVVEFKTADPDAFLAGAADMARAGGSDAGDGS